MEDFVSSRFKELLKENIKNKNIILKAYKKPKLKFNEIYKEYKAYAKILKPYVCDTVTMLHKAIKKGEKILCEGAQASLLDIDFGSYPFVTSSNPTIGGAITGTGIGAKYIGDVYGVIKAYSSRVGAGTFVTELNDATGDKIRELGHEYGVTTKRPRRCGWLDAVALNYACMINGLTGLCVNHLDTIGKYDKIKMSIAYEYKGKKTTDLTTNIDFLSN